MWSYYAEGHQGLVIGLDTNVRKLVGDEFQRIKYAASRPTIGYGDENAWKKAIFTKAKCWQHEQEWRAIRVEPTEESCKVIGEVPPEAVREVVIGCRMPSNVRKQIAECLSDSRFAHVVLHEAYPHKKLWTLQRRRIALSALIA